MSVYVQSSYAIVFLTDSNGLHKLNLYTLVRGLDLAYTNIQRRALLGLVEELVQANY